MGPRLGGTKGCFQGGKTGGLGGGTTGGIGGGTTGGGGGTIVGGLGGLGIGGLGSGRGIGVNVGSNPGDDPNSSGVNFLTKGVAPLSVEYGVYASTISSPVYGLIGIILSLSLINLH